MPLGPEDYSSISPFLRKHLRSHAEAAQEIRRSGVEKLNATKKKEVEFTAAILQKDAGANRDAALELLKIAPAARQRRDGLPKP